MFNQWKVLDFHTHPFMTAEQNICSHADYYPMSAEQTVADLQKLGYDRIAGSVLQIPGIAAEDVTWDYMQRLNDTALRLREQYGDFYVPGFHIHPFFVKESLKEMERMKQEGVRLIGELTPYLHGWSDVADERFSELLFAAEENGFILSLHTMDDDRMDKMVEEHPGLTVVAAHPGEYDGFMRHLNRMQMSENYYLDVSGTGLFRHGLLRHGIDAYGAERFLYGSDYPTCAPAMFLGGVALDYTLTDDEKKAILWDNGDALLKKAVGT